MNLYSLLEAVMSLLLPTLLSFYDVLFLRSSLVYFIFYLLEVDFKESKFTLTSENEKKKKKKRKKTKTSKYLHLILNKIRSKHFSLRLCEKLQINNFI